MKKRDDTWYDHVSNVRLPAQQRGDDGREDQKKLSSSASLFLENKKDEKA